MVNVVVELFDGTCIEMRRVKLGEALQQLWRSYGEEIMSMTVEQSNKQPARSHRTDGDGR